MTEAIAHTEPQRLEVFTRPRYRDGRVDGLLNGLRRSVSEAIQDLAVVDVYLLNGFAPLGAEVAAEVFQDSVAQELLINAHAAEQALGGAWSVLVEITSRPGVTDPIALTAREALRVCLAHGVPDRAIVQTAIQYLVTVRPGAAIQHESLARFFFNPLIQSAFCVTREQWAAGERPPRSYPSVLEAAADPVRTVALAGLSDAELQAISRQRLLALSLSEMKAVQRCFSDPATRAERAQRGLPPEPTDVELEMIAQTWSEHCKHKIFNARIRYTENGRERIIDSLFQTYIRKTTEELARSRRFLRSVFHDNSGVIALDRDTLVCFKVETHNSPSALDPYGGAITGIVGVNRDIMGTGLGAKPLFNTDVLCFGFPDTPDADVPAGLIPPRRVMEGVHRGIIDGGNQSGIPVAAGAFLFDESYLGKPLVFCGTGGVLPARIRGRDACEKRIVRGDLAVMVGGRIGKDGIHGATFSSEALSESSPTSAVQIGDPITQKKMLDLLLEARDQGLYRGLTDNGAGGLSSSLGEMAGLCGGIRIDLDACPLKYQGLAAWEILVSESQERMSLAVPPADLQAFMDLARRRNVEATVVGEFNDSGRVDITFGGALVGSLELAFLHDGLPVMDLPARWTSPSAAAAAVPSSTDLPRLMLAMLADANVCSREEWVRRYDHEVQARSVVKPFVGRRRDAPSDGAVLRVNHDSHRGITVTHGICPRYGDHDTYDMAQCAVDEAVRAHVALGGDPEAMAALDNFCWPDPVESPTTPDGAFKLGQLVRACEGLADACRAFQVPLISGKDSMKNDARVAGRVISIRPTLLVSLMGIIRDVRRAQTTELKAAGDLLYVVGETRGELGGTIFERVVGQRLGASPSVHAARAFSSYRKLHNAMRKGLVRSCHDLSDAGLWGALAESCIGGDLGAVISLDSVPIAPGMGIEPERLLFCETPSRFLVSVTERSKARWEKAMAGVPIGALGRATGEPRIIVRSHGQDISSHSLSDVRAAWKGREGVSR